MLHEPDLQTQQLSAGLTQLYEVLDQPVATHALELSKNAEAASNFENLKRLQKSLRQYLERDSDLFYVGLLGHFSAGKSSTINSLLKAWDGPTERKTSLNPTDTTITLITQEKNAEALVGVIREGHVPIRLEKLDSPLLANLVLVDTPGTGDPQFIEEVARDFLPICDVVLFLFSAASPLDKSDVPLLEELHKRLPFIPLHFVVTRSDELRMDSHRVLSEDNFDQQKVKVFLDEVLDRVNKILAPQVYQPGSFSFVDNRAEFGIAALSSFLSAKCDAGNPQAHVSMHMNKVQYYMRGFKQLKTYFAEVLDRKLAELSRIVSAAARNIERYQQFVSISNSNLSKTWGTSAHAVSLATATSIEALKAPPALPTQYAHFGQVVKKQNEIAAEFQRDAKSQARSIHFAFQTELYTAFRDHLYIVEKGISEAALHNLAATSHTISSIPVALALRSQKISKPVHVAERIRDLREAELLSLKDHLSELRRSVRALEESLEQRGLLKRLQNIIAGAQTALRAELSNFFQSVELYRSGVFAHTTKESISTLGIGQQLDALESEFTDDDREHLTMNALDRLFPNALGVMEEASQGMITAMTPVHLLSERTREPSFENAEDKQSLINSMIEDEQAVLERQVLHELQPEVDAFIGRLNVELADLLVGGRKRYDDAANELASRRRKLYVSAALIAAIIYTALVFRYPSPNTSGAEFNIRSRVVERWLRFGRRVSGHCGGEAEN